MFVVTEIEEVKSSQVESRSSQVATAQHFLLSLVVVVVVVVAAAAMAWIWNSQFSQISKVQTRRYEWHF